MTRTTTSGLTLALAVALGGALAASCSSSNSDGGGAVSGEVDQHCVMNDEQIKTPVGQCITAGTGGADAGAPDPDAGTGDPGTSDFGETQFNAEGDDDDCKYHVKWTSSGVKLNGDVTFDVNVKRLIDGAAATGADVSIEAFLDATHPTPSTDISSAESAGGNYKVGKVRFDAKGRWTVRFHFYETCSDEPEDSPHGHIAFYVDVK